MICMLKYTCMCLDKLYQWRVTQYDSQLIPIGVS